MEVKLTSEVYQKPVSAAAGRPASKEAPADSQTKRLDTYERAAGTPFVGHKMLAGSADGLRWDGTVPDPGTLILNEPDPDADGINWEEVGRSFSNAAVTLDNADKLESSVERIASLYLSVKDQLEQRFSGREDILTEKMGKLDAMFQNAKNRMVSSYKGTVGSFYEGLGNKGISSKMGDSLSAAIDRKVEEMEAYGKEHGILGNPEDERKLPYDVKAVFLQAGMLAKRDGRQAASTQSVSQKGTEDYYSMSDLQAAGFAAKAAASMNPGELSLMGDGELGIQMALRYMKMAQALGHLGAGDKMSSLILDSFSTFLDQYSGKALSDKGPASDAYHYALKQYESTGDMGKALAQSAGKYLDDGFFSLLIASKNGTGASKFTRYQLELSQFAASLERGDRYEMLNSIAGKGRPYVSMYA